MGAMSMLRPLWSTCERARRQAGPHQLHPALLQRWPRAPLLRRRRPPPPLLSPSAPPSEPPGLLWMPCPPQLPAHQAHHILWHGVCRAHRDSVHAHVSAPLHCDSSCPTPCYRHSQRQCHAVLITLPEACDLQPQPLHAGAHLGVRPMAACRAPGCSQLLLEGLHSRGSRPCLSLLCAEALPEAVVVRCQTLVLLPQPLQRIPARLHLSTSYLPCEVPHSSYIMRFCLLIMQRNVTAHMVCLHCAAEPLPD